MALLKLDSPFQSRFLCYCRCFKILLQNRIFGTFAGSIFARIDIRCERLSTYYLESYIAANSGNLIICFVKLIRNSIAPNVFRFGIDFASEVDCLTTKKTKSQLTEPIDCSFNTILRTEHISWQTGKPAQQWSELLTR